MWEFGIRHLPRIVAIDLEVPLATISQNLRGNTCRKTPSVLGRKAVHLSDLKSVDFQKIPMAIPSQDLCC